MSSRAKIRYSVDQILAKARQITGIDIDDVDAVEPLTVLLQSYNEETALNEKTVPFLEDYLLRMLSNRLRMQRDIAAHPEILEQDIQAPIFICGMARTGSTKLQKLLAASEDFNWMPFWMSLNPALYTGSRDESPAARIEDTDRFVARINEVSPDIRTGHEYATREPEEEYWALKTCLKLPLLIPTRTPSFMHWLNTFDSMAFQMHFLRQALQYLQWQGLGSSSKRWVLKCPHYFGCEPAIKKAFPDAVFLMTHRHPKETIPSLCSFLAAMSKLVSDVEGDPSLYLAAGAYQIGQHVANRSNNLIECFDIDYRELITGVGAAMDKIYAYAGVELREASRQRMLDWDRNHPIHARGAHKYTLADFGMTEQDIARDFAGYIKLLDEIFVK